MISLQQARTRARTKGNSRLQDVCKVEIDNPDAGTPVRDPETGDVTYPDARLTIYGPGIEPHHGACRVRMATAAASVIQGPDGQVVLTLSAIVVPADVALPRGADVTMLESDNPAAVGITRTIRARDTGSQKSTNRYGFEEVN